MRPSPPGCCAPRASLSVRKTATTPSERRRVKVSLQVDYACRVMAELARLHGSGELAQIERLAQAEAVPANFLAQILLKLRDHGLIASRRGNQGGYSLARAPEEISLYDILVAVEGRCL